MLARTEPSLCNAQLRLNLVSFPSRFAANFLRISVRSSSLLPLPRARANSSRVFPSALPHSKALDRRHVQHRAQQRGVRVSRATFSPSLFPSSSFSRRRTDSTFPLPVYLQSPYQPPISNSLRTTQLQADLRYDHRGRRGRIVPSRSRGFAPEQDRSLLLWTFCSCKVYQGEWYSSTSACLGSRKRREEEGDGETSS